MRLDRVWRWGQLWMVPVVGVLMGCANSGSGHQASRRPSGGSAGAAGIESPAAGSGGRASAGTSSMGSSGRAGSGGTGGGAAEGGESGSGAGGAPDEGAGEGGACAGGACHTDCAGCLVAGLCHADGTTNPDNPCEVCSHSVDPKAFRAKSDGTACVDGDACTSGDECVGGQCKGTAKSCDDGLDCTAGEHCDSATGDCVAGESQCDPGFCDSTLGECVTECASGCLVQGVCYPAGATKTGAACLVCDPERSITEWSPNTGASCDLDDNPCFEAAACSGAGVCERAPLLLGAACGDHKACTGDQDAPECTCAAGYVLESDECVDVDECAEALDDCDDAPDACANDAGSYHCQCPAGFDGNGQGTGGCTCSRNDYSPLCNPWTFVSTAYTSACAVAGGALYCWGLNDSGQLGVGDVKSRAVPTRVGTDLGWQMVSTGSDHACGIREGGVYCWGKNGSQVLGVSGNGRAPARVGTNDDWTWVTATGSTLCGLREGGNVYCWGVNIDGSIGTGGTEAVYSTPQLVSGAGGFTTVNGSQATLCAIRAGRLYCWGQGELLETADRPLPVQITSFEDYTAVDLHISGGCAVRNGGELDCWSDTLDPQPVAGRSDWVSISQEWNDRCGVTSSGQAYCTGINSAGAFGDGTTKKSDVPVLVGGFSNWSMIATGDGVSFGIHDGGLYAWGSNETGVRGTGFVLERVGSASDWLKVSTGLSYTCGIRQPGSLFCWGNVPGSAGVATPTQVGADSDWTAVSGGWEHVCGLRQGSVYCFGDNDEGELGDGTTTDRPSPVKVGARTDWVRVTASTSATNHSCAVSSGGDLACWGANGSGQLGDGTTTNRTTPVAVSGIGWTAAEAGDQYTCGVNSGRLYCWGDGNYGHLGSSSTTDRSTPFAIGSSTGWTAVATGFAHACGLLNGAPTCWGTNVFGELGIGSVTSGASGPVAASVAGSFGEIAAGKFSSLALRADGSAFGWGDNDLGPLGTGDFVDHSAPAAALSGTDWHDVTIENDHSCAIQNGALYCWGANPSNCLGTGEGLSPAPVENGL